MSKIVRIDSVNNLKLRSHIYHHNIRNTTLHTIFHVLFLFICLNFSNKSKIKCATNAAAISGGMSHTMFPVIFVSILLYNLQKMFFSTFQQISMSNSHRTSCEFLKDIFGRISGADSGARWSPSRISGLRRGPHSALLDTGRLTRSVAGGRCFLLADLLLLAVQPHNQISRSSACGLS